MDPQQQADRLAGGFASTSQPATSQNATSQPATAAGAVDSVDLVSDEEVDSPGPSRAGRKTSVIKQQHFTKQPLPPGASKASKRNPYKCKYCPAVINRSENAVLAKHLLDSCPSVSPEIQRDVQALVQEAQAGLPPGLPLPGTNRRALKASGRATSSAVSQGSSGGQADMRAFAARQPSAAEVETMNTKLLRLLVMTGVSFHVVDSPYFLDFVQELRPMYIPAGTVYGLGL
jgi:hypothetical protein